MVPIFNYMIPRSCDYYKLWMVYLLLRRPLRTYFGGSSRRAPVVVYWIRCNRILSRGFWRRCDIHGTRVSGTNWSNCDTRCPWKQFFTLIFTSRDAALRQDCLYPPARPSILVSHAPGGTSRFWLARRRPSQLFWPAAGLRSPPAARAWPNVARPSVSPSVSHARGHTSSQSDHYIDCKFIDYNSRPQY